MVLLVKELVVCRQCPLHTCVCAAAFPDQYCGLCDCVQEEEH